MEINAVYGMLPGLALTARSAMLAAQNDRSNTPPPASGMAGSMQTGSAGSQMKPEILRSARAATQQRKLLVGRKLG